jgi:hypothetical protein
MLGRFVVSTPGEIPMIRPVTSSIALVAATLLAVACGGGTPEAKSAKADAAPVTVASCADHALAAKKACSDEAVPPEAKEEATGACSSAAEAKVMEKVDACFVAAIAQKTHEACEATLKPCLEAVLPH